MKKQNLITIIIFLIVITVPTIMMFHDPGRYLPGDNRMATPMPEMFDMNGNYNRTGIESFVNDNIGFRTAAPTLDTRVMYDIFRVILDGSQLQGKEHHLFYGGNRHFPTYRAPNKPVPEEELIENARNIKAASDYFAMKDIPFIFITIPNKEEVYPELYPDTFIQRPEKGILAQQTEWLIENTDVDAYDMTRALREISDELDVMLWNETEDSAHWNNMGAYYGYREIMKRLDKYDPSLRTLELEDFDITVTVDPYSNWDGSFIFRDLYNTRYTFDYKSGFESFTVDYLDDPWLPPDRLAPTGFEKEGHYFHYHNDNAEGQLVFFGDSYIYQFLLPYFAESFADVYLFHLPTDYRIMKPVLEMIGADYIILQTVERSYNGSNFLYMADQFASEPPV